MPQSGQLDSRSERNQRTRERILDAAEEVFARHGYHDGSMAEIARVAGLAQGTTYLYFASKKELFSHLLTSRRDDLRQATREASEAATSHNEVVRFALKAFCDWVAEHPSSMRLVREAEVIDPSLLARLYDLPATEQIDEIERLMQAGTLERTDPEVLAWSIMGACEFVAMKWIAWGNGTMPPDKFEAFLQILFRMTGNREAQSAATPANHG